MSQRNLRWATIAAALGLLVGCSGSISEPWVSGAQAERLEDERTRSTEQQRALRDRLANYGGAYR
ncbi:MAG: hypothetical protein ACLFRM_09050 [Guyparkeria sp.]|uniref:hypothetical protein n=1 Tax=Guyparkeria sp. TaxID=2035736 RepID=UPI00397E1843